MSQSSSHSYMRDVCGCHVPLKRVNTLFRAPLPAAVAIHLLSLVMLLGTVSRNSCDVFQQS